MKELIDFDRYPLDRESPPHGRRWSMRPGRHWSRMGCSISKASCGRASPRRRSPRCVRVIDRSHEHRRWHNIYFKPHVPDLAPDHPALRKVETISHTVCADQIADSVVLSIYQYEPLIRFLAATMDKPRLHAMQDPLARANVMSNRDGEALNWHFDRSEFTTTLLLQAPEQGGDFDIPHRSARRRPQPTKGSPGCSTAAIRSPKFMRVKPGTLNVFRGKNPRIASPRSGRARPDDRGVFLLREAGASCSVPKSASASTAGLPDS